MIKYTPNKWEDDDLSKSEYLIQCNACGKLVDKFFIKRKISDQQNDLMIIAQCLPCHSVLNQMQVI